MAISVDSVSVISQNIRKSGVKLQQPVKIESSNKVLHEEEMTLPEIKLHLDDILRETQITYTIDESDTGFVIKVMDKKTDKVIKEIPSHDIQVLRKHFKNHLGVLFNELI